ncbi:ABC-type multidrug transport system, ATPase component [Leptolyngbya sp. PCC 7375]|nr:ABC-type multidrug transport system, ATPase component [Leptolyngbya sp. PCC 7375]
MNLIELDHVTKAFSNGLFNKQTVLRDITLSIRPGDFVVLRGANGAGKSTLLKIILGLLQPDTGDAQLFGMDPSQSTAKLGLGSVFQEVTPPSSLKVKELLALIASYYPDAKCPHEILDLVELTHKANAYPQDLSGGEKQRLYFAIALVGNPRLLILDEPTKNLDIEGQVSFWQQIEACYQAGVTILMVTHIQSEQNKLQTLATHIITLSDGQLATDKAPEPQSIPPLAQTENIHSPVQHSKPLYQLLLTQLWSESLQLFRTPVYLLGVFILFGLALPIAQFVGILGMVFSSALALLIFSVAISGKRLAIDRTEGWLKLLRVTPLPSGIYVLGKMLITLSVSAVALGSVFTLSAFKLSLFSSVGQALVLAISLLIGSIPFILLGFALGYLIAPKSLDAIVGLLVPIAIFSSGFPGLTVPDYVQDAISLSPFFHYKEVIQLAAGLGQTQYLWLHILWLGLYAFAIGYLANLAYKQDKIA